MDIELLSYLYAQVVGTFVAFFLESAMKDGELSPNTIAERKAMSSLPSDGPSPGNPAKYMFEDAPTPEHILWRRRVWLERGWPLQGDLRPGSIKYVMKVLAPHANASPKATPSPRNAHPLTPQAPARQRKAKEDQDPVGADENDADANSCAFAATPKASTKKLSESPYLMQTPPMKRSFASCQRSCNNQNSYNVENEDKKGDCNHEVAKKKRKMD